MLTATPRRFNVSAMADYELTAECFVLPEGDEYLVYFPLRGYAYLTNEDGAALIAHLRREIHGPLNEAVGRSVAQLVEMGLVNGPPDEFPEAAAPEPFAPSDVTLLLTHDCNLRCTYCYARGGERSRQLDEDVAMAALRLTLDNARRAGVEETEVTFHGGGEPTLAFPLMRRVVERGRDLARESGVEVRFSLCSNGVIPDLNLRWILQNIQELTLSIDGAPTVQDRQRPLAGGGGSAARVERTLRALSEAGADYSVRATVTAASVHATTELVEYLGRLAPPRVLHLEPVHQCGVSRRGGAGVCEASAFLAAFRAAEAAAEPFGIELFYSGARLDTLDNRFCGTATGAFTVTPEGRATACYEVSHPDDPRRHRFTFGAYDPAASGFWFDPEKLRSLARITVNRLDYCADCFCKWHCAGDCPVRRDSLERFAGSSRCEINQALTRDQLLRKIGRGARS